MLRLYSLLDIAVIDINGAVIDWYHDSRITVITESEIQNRMRIILISFSSALWVLCALIDNVQPLYLAIRMYMVGRRELVRVIQ